MMFEPRGASRKLSLLRKTKDGKACSRYASQEVIVPNAAPAHLKNCIWRHILSQRVRRCNVASRHGSLIRSNHHADQKTSSREVRTVPDGLAFARGSEAFRDGRSALLHVPCLRLHQGRQTEAPPSR